MDCGRAIRRGSNYVAGPRPAYGKNDFIKFAINVLIQRVIVILAFIDAILLLSNFKGFAR